MAEPITALIVRILADTSEMVTGVKTVSGQLDTLENRVSRFGKVLAGVFTVRAVAGFAKEILADVSQIDAASKRLGSSTEEFQKFSFAVKQSGGDAVAAATGIASLTDLLANGDAGLLAVLRKLNINLDDFKSKDAVSRFVALATAINGVTDPTERLELRLEAMGVKGEKALAAVDENFKKLAENAPVYSDETIQALKRVEDGWDRLWMSIKTGAAESAVAVKDFLDPSKTMILDENGAPKFFSGSGDVNDLKNPTAPNNLPAALGLGGVDPNDARALAVVYADLALSTIQAAAGQRELKEAQDAGIAVMKMLRLEAPALSDAIGQLMDKMGTSTKVDQFTQRIISQAQRIADLTRETERLLEVINPGSTRIAGDDVDAEIFKLRSDPRNWITSGPEKGNLTPQALDIEHRLINNFSLGLVANQLRPTSAASMPSFGAPFPGMPTGVGAPVSITVNAQGGWWDSPDRINQMARLVEDSIAKRSGLANTYTRR
jgi:hypothetical protein